MRWIVVSVVLSGLGGCWLTDAEVAKKLQQPPGDTGVDDTGVDDEGTDGDG